MNTNVLTIGHLARETGTKVETVRFYEKNGLLPAPSRAENNYRSYDRSHLNRLSFIRRARDLGFSIRFAHCLTWPMIANSHVLRSMPLPTSIGGRSSARFVTWRH